MGKKITQPGHPVGSEEKIYQWNEVRNGWSLIKG
jgi:hypothetical protein